MPISPINDLQNSIDAIRNGDELEVKVTSKVRDKKPPYIALGNGRASRHFSEGVVVDALDVFLQMSPAQMKIFKYFKDLVVEEDLHHHARKSINDRPNCLLIPKSKYNKQALEVKELIRANNNMRKIIELGAVRKIRQGEYMINPYLMVPIHNFTKAVNEWEKLEE